MRAPLATFALLVSTLLLPAQTRPLPPFPPSLPPGARLQPTRVPGETPVSAPPVAPVVVASANPLVWDTLVKQVTTKPEDKTAEFTFWVTNTSATADAAINSAHTSCGCTVAKMPSQPWVLKPGESGPLTANMNVLGKHGLVIKTITLDTSGGPQILTVRSDVTGGMPALLPNISPRESNQMAALSDRQAIFRNDCVKCHVEPAVGRTGEKLFITACGICHTAEHRAAMVPDLSAIKTDTNADFWRTWITFGKPATLMAAFSKQHGGILDDAQIDSLVQYLVKTYPSKIAGSGK